MDFLTYYLANGVNDCETIIRDIFAAMQIEYLMYEFEAKYEEYLLYLLFTA